ncbi:MAG TPA: hypothetical protein VND94_17255 [Terriglobia bacterium]|nr:hypothetical protein [Terriglobia bacterium]
MAEVFVSKPNALTSQQLTWYSLLRQKLGERGLNPRTLGETDFQNSPPMTAVIELMRLCDGALILGLSQTFIKEGLHKPGTDNEVPMRESCLPSPWNHIEAAVAFALGRPTLIIRERGISGGVFDMGITDRFIHQADLNADWLSSQQFLQPFNLWHEEILTQAH